MPRRHEPQITVNKGYLRVRWTGKEYSSIGAANDPAAWARAEDLKRDLLRGPGGGLAIADLVNQYWQHAKVYYRHSNGEPTSEARSIKANLEALLPVYAHGLAQEFGPQQLKAHRQQLVDGGHCRKSINQEIGRIVRMFRWATAEELLEPEVWHRLAAVGGLKQGRTTAPDRPKVKPVVWPTVEATLPFLPPPLQAAVWMQRLSICCRPDEALRLRPCDVDRRGEVWVYAPTCPDTGKPRHKTAWRGKPRRILIGPELQPILAPWLDATPPAEFCFSPAKETERRRSERRAQRQSKVPPSQLDRSKPEPKKKPGARYSVSSYANAIEAAIARANLARGCHACKQLEYPEPCGRCVVDGKPKPLNRRCRSCRTRSWCDACRANLIPHWAPNMIRHGRLTELERRYGIRDAQRAGGHSSPATTEIYVAEDLERLRAIALEVG